MTPTNNPAEPRDEDTEFVYVRRLAVEWLKTYYPALTVKAGLCESIGGRLYTRTKLTPPHQPASPDVARMVECDFDWISRTLIDAKDDMQQMNAKARPKWFLDGIFARIDEAVDMLSAATQAKAAAPALAREPLTGEQKRTMWKVSTFRGSGGQRDWYLTGIEDAERAHGITADSAMASASEPLSVSEREVKP